MKTLISIILISIISSSYAEVHFLKDNSGSGQVSLKQDWRHLKDSFGIPFIFVSKGKSPNSSIGITFSGIKNAKINPKALKDTQDKYFEGRKAWANKSDAQTLKFKKYKFFKNQNKIPVHSIGFDYKRNGSTFSETSYYLECHKNFVHVKTLIYSKHTVLRQDALEAINSFKCK